MSAPVVAAPMNAVAEISAQIAAIQATIASVLGPPVPAAAGTASGTRFATALSAAAAPAAAAPAPPAAGVTGAGVTGAAVVADAEKYLGVPYVWGGESRSGMDCSGLVQTAFGDLGIDLPRVAADQARVGTPVASLADAKPGDLLFFGDPAYHVAIYLGDNRLIESPEPGKTVHMTDVYQTPTSIRRVVPDQPAAAAASPAGGAGLSAAQLQAAGLNPAVAAYASQFAAAEARYGLPTGLLAAVAQQESGGNARALSPAGAEGLMQLMPSTAAGIGVNPDDPAQAIAAAAKILAASVSRYGGSVPLALAAYNAGPGAVAQYGGIPPFPETQNYVKRITAMLAVGG